MEQHAGPLADVAAYSVAGDPPLRLWAHSLGLACCAVEAAAALARLRAGAGGGATGPRNDSEVVDVLVVAGTVTDRMAPAVVALHGRLSTAGGRCRVMSFGACANSGGPYWDSYSVTKGIDQLLPVDLYVPGCPPRPEALLDALEQLAASDST